MISFLFEEYGYYPNSLQDNLFFINDWAFKIIEVDCDEEHVKRIDEYARVIRDNFNSIGPYIINNREGRKVSFYDGKSFVLVSVKKSNLAISDFNKMHLLFSENERAVFLDELLLSWKARLSDIESKGVSSLKIDAANYDSNLMAVMYFIGMGHNAIQYLADIILDGDSRLKNVTITHKRCPGLDSVEFLNPFNLVVDHPLRDFVELYRNNVIDFENLIMCLEYYNIDCKSASLFIARLLYPVTFLDLLEKKAESKGLDMKSVCVPEKEFLKIKKTYIYFRRKYNIRPIEWLEN